MKILLNVSCNDEFFDEYPPTAIVEFTKESIERILKLMDTAKYLGVAKICDWDSPEWLTNFPIEDDEEPKEWDGRCECEMAYIWHECVSWYAYIKDTGIEFGTYDSIYREKLNEILKFVDEDILIYIDNLNEVIKVYNTPEKELPLLIGSLESKEALSILEKRLKNG